ncbi:hypothetical protein QMK19_26395 [Streptomyces sp. H10-C2]|uniref:hypothetical protein n=1 Tax=unclassified Streptomyces TaxID=2593676 RepID=UPI0024B88F0B|nr:MULTISPECIES: hypothetical protein [unclassified Streptomyces]MDJ0344147.1 hypothetical protein [Streptomyces sp. PH10-H1]MDJ0373094.1 hypothetical protein [Streptomyces sp. H10-C2]
MIPIQAALFWAYALGATFAVSATRQLQFWRRWTVGSRQREAAPEALPGVMAVRIGGPTANPYLCLTVLFAAVLLVPTGLFLLWQNPSWQTMQVAGGHRGLWPGFVLLYAAGIVVAALLGFLIAQALAVAGIGYWAYLQTVGGYFLVFATLIHGWDGEGYRRFLTTSQQQFTDWPKDSVVNRVLDFATSGTFLALVVLGFAVITTMLVTEIGWLVEGWRLPGGDTDRKVPRIVAVAIAGAGVYALPFGGAVTASVLVHLLGWPVGLALFAVVAGAVLLPRRTPVRRLYDLVGIPAGHWRDLDQPPVAEHATTAGAP